ncbi:MAG: hypothetical protein LQ338_007058 [Usnochroma carphineum]|nr:MAG: hypothetical protein LQ338_007058 [Usnochroma carphineum]
MSSAERIPAHDLLARHAARQSYDRPWLTNSVLPSQGLSIRSVSNGTCVASASPYLQHDAPEEWDIQTPVTGTTSSVSSSTPLTFTSPLPRDPEIMRVNEFLKDIPGFDFSLRFLGPCRAVDIPVPQRTKLAKYLRCTAEAICFDWFRRWMPEQMELIMVGGADQLDLPAWAFLLEEHYRSAPADAFGLPTAHFDFWCFTSVGVFRHTVVHRRDFTTDRISAVLRLALALKDEQRASYVQYVVKTLYDALSSGEPLDYNFIDEAPNLRPALTQQLDQFRMLYSIMDLLCQQLLNFSNAKSPGTFPDLTIEELEFSDLEIWVHGNYRFLVPGKEGRYYVDGLIRRCRELRNYVEHRNLMTAEQARSMAEAAANIAEMIDVGPAKEIRRMLRRFSSAISNIRPNKDLPRSLGFLKSMKHLDCWERGSCLAASRNSSRALIVRQHHPYLYWARAAGDLEVMAVRAERERNKWLHPEDPDFSNTRPAYDRGLIQAYGLTAKWYRKINSGEIDVDDARSPAVDLWNGKFDDAPADDEPSSPVGWALPQEPPSPQSATSW